MRRNYVNTYAEHRQHDLLFTSLKMVAKKEGPENE